MYYSLISTEIFAIPHAFYIRVIIKVPARETRGVGAKPARRFPRVKVIFIGIPTSPRGLGTWHSGLRRHRITLSIPFSRSRFFLYGG